MVNEGAGDFFRKIRPPLFSCPGARLDSDGCRSCGQCSRESGKWRWLTPKRLFARSRRRDTLHVSQQQRLVEQSAGRFLPWKGAAMTIEDIRRRIARLAELSIGLNRERVAWEEAQDPLLYLERKAYLQAVRQAISGVEGRGWCWYGRSSVWNGRQG